MGARARILVAQLLLIALTSSGCAAARSVPPTAGLRSATALPGVVVVDHEPAPVPGYDRSCGAGRGCVFGPAWSDDVTVRLGHNGCDTRNDLLREALVEVRTKPGTHGCLVLSGVLLDPYSGARVPFSREQAGTLEIDHVLPLAVAWNRGAATWSLDRRRDFANDPDELIATTAAANRAKGDRTPAQWLPSTARGRCLLARRFLQVARTWNLVITRAENDAIAHTLATC